MSAIKLAKTQYICIALLANRKTLHFCISVQRVKGQKTTATKGQNNSNKGPKQQQQRAKTTATKGQNNSNKGPKQQQQRAKTTATKAQKFGSPGSLACLLSLSRLLLWWSAGEGDLLLLSLGGDLRLVRSDLKKKIRIIIKIIFSIIKKKNRHRSTEWESK